MGGRGPADDAAARSHRALRAIRRELDRNPIVTSARGFPPDAHATVEADIDADRVEGAVGDATLTVRWYDGELSGRPEFSVHYSDDAGADFGWHHEPNPHVEGWGHYQERPDASAAYDYEPYSFATLVPSRVVWEVAARLRERLAERG